jgi:hypothetical protein
MGISCCRNKRSVALVWTCRKNEGERLEVANLMVTRHRTWEWLQGMYKVTERELESPTVIEYKKNYTMEVRKMKHGLGEESTTTTVLQFGIPVC